jgi:cyclic beta-1,2-glucan synthetase
LPTPADGPYLIRHGAGYTTITHHSHLLQQHVRIYILPDAPMKVVQLRLENSSPRPRRITATFYAEWVLGVDRATMQQYILPEYEAQSWALLARNPYNSEFAERVAFVASSKQPHGLTADRNEFLGRLGDLRHPAALARVGLAGRVEAGLDPCAALQLHLDLPPKVARKSTF